MRIAENQILENIATDDGGGIYMSVRAYGAFERNVIQSNRARGAGGGLRASFGCDIVMQGDKIISNRSNSSLDVPARSGGGGIAARNSTLLLSDVTIEANTANGFAGGGITLLPRTKD